MPILPAAPANDVPFWQTLDELVATSKIVIDRPKQTSHPRFPDLIYPLDYGYLDGTTAGDGDGIDVWIGNDPAAGVTAVACTVDGCKRDAEIKVLFGCSEADSVTISHFLNSIAGLPCIIIPRATRQVSDHG